MHSKCELTEIVVGHWMALHADTIRKWELSVQPLISTPTATLACNRHSMDFTSGTLSTFDVDEK